MHALAIKAAASFVLAAGPAFSLTATPAHIVAHPGDHVRVEVIDTGTKPLMVKTSLLNIRKSGRVCGVRDGSVPGVTVTPVTVRLLPHGHAYATVKISRQ